MPVATVALSELAEKGADVDVLRHKTALRARCLRRPERSGGASEWRWIGQVDLPSASHGPIGIGGAVGSASTRRLRRRRCTTGTAALRIPLQHRTLPCGLAAGLHGQIDFVWRE